MMQQIERNVCSSVRKGNKNNDEAINQETKKNSETVSAHERVKERMKEIEFHFETKLRLGTTISLERSCR